MIVSKIYIQNYKSFKERTEIILNKGINILVGDNEAGKSTILEAVHFALTGMLSGRYLKNELSEYLFNKETVFEYLMSLETSAPLPPPQINIEVYFEKGSYTIFEGDGNVNKDKAEGFSCCIHFDDKNSLEYEQLIARGDVKTLPIEFYEIRWMSFARDYVTPRVFPIKSALIDSAVYKFQNGSDIYISRIIKDILDHKEVAGLSLAHRKVKQVFMEDETVLSVNQKLKEAGKISEKDVKLSVDLSARNSWEGSLLTYLNDIPFHHIGKGEQCVIKTKLALGHKKAQEANFILLEEPENHLSHINLNKLINDIKTNCEGKQILISTHSSFVANKLDLQNLILLNDKRILRITDLTPETRGYFEKLAGYETLRLILCPRAILVEGDSDELIIQKAYRQKHNGKLPIEDGVDVISVGTAFLRFLEIAVPLQKNVAVVTDNDGDPEAVKKKYSAYANLDHIEICFDNDVDRGPLDEKHFNYNTLEPKLLKANNTAFFNRIFNTKYKTQEEMLVYMRNNKTECALKIFNSEEELQFPDYIIQAVQ